MSLKRFHQAEANNFKSVLFPDELKTTHHSRRLSNRNSLQQVFPADGEIAPGLECDNYGWGSVNPGQSRVSSLPSSPHD